MKRSILVLVIVCALAVANIVEAGEVWFASNYATAIERMTFDGVVLPSFGGLPDFVETLAVVGDEVWMGGAGSSSVHRMALDGTPLSSIDTGYFDVRDIEVIPEPTTLLLLGLGAVMLRRQQKKLNGRVVAGAEYQYQKLGFAEAVSEAMEA